jgi:hypothetical protein
MTSTYEGAMGLANTETERAEKASRQLKAELKRAGITYAGLANLLKKNGFRDETKAGVSNKLARGTFTATFFLASLVAIGDAYDPENLPLRPVAAESVSEKCF